MSNPYCCEPIQPLLTAPELTKVMCCCKRSREAAEHVLELFAKANETEKWDGQARTTTYAFPGMRTLRIHDGGYRFA